MEKEKIELFAQRRLPPPERGTVGRGGIMRILALGMALFSVVFLICCLGVGLRRQDRGPERIDMSVLGEGGVLASARPRPDGSGSADTARPGYAGRDTTAAGQQGALSSNEGGSDADAPKDIYAYDPASVPQGHTPIRPYDLSLRSFGEGFIYNNTSYTPDIAALLKRKTLPKLVDTSSSPVVLIVHTHGTEAYSPSGSLSYDGVSTLARSGNTDENVVAVGRVMASELNRLGVNTLHCEIMHDEQSYRDSYARSAATIKEYLRKYPTIKYVFDVHRDSVTDSTGALLRPVTTVGGRTAAQVMCVVGSDAGGTACPRWQENLAFALRLRAELNGEDGSLARPVCLRTSAYNQQYAPRSLLLEVGTSGNYLEEALVAAKSCAGALARLIRGE